MPHGPLMGPWTPENLMWKAHSRGLTGASKTSEIEADLIDGWMVPRNQGIWAKLGEVWLNYSNLLYQLDKSWPSHCRLGFGPMLSLRLLNTAFIFLADATSEMIQEESSVVQPGLLLPHDIIPSPTLGHLRDNSGLEIMCCLGLFFLRWRRGGKHRKQHVQHLPTKCVDNDDNNVYCYSDTMMIN